MVLKTSTFLFLLYLCSPLSSLVWAQEINFDVSSESNEGPSHLSFNENEILTLKPLLDAPFFPGTESFAEQFSPLPEALKEKVLQLGNSDFRLLNNTDALNFSRANNLSPEECLNLIFDFRNGVAKTTIEKLLEDPNLQIRLLSRDMDPFYFQTLEVIRNSETLTPKQKLDLTHRIRLVMLSRPLSKIATPADLGNILQFSKEDFENHQSVIILDTGYEGNIVTRFQALAGADPRWQQVRWNFLWRGPKAFELVDLFPIESLWQNLSRRFGNIMKEPEWVGDWQPHSVRVSLIEHQPKWIERAEKISRDPHYLMLDVDDTILKETSIDNKEDPFVQTIHYTPSKNAFERYQKRLESGPANGRVIHYDLHADGSMTGYVSVRPVFSLVLEDLMPLIESGDLHILLTSSNDEARTSAILEQLKFGGKTLKDLGAQVMNRSQFGVKSGKSTLKIRKSLNLPENAWIAALDDIPEQFIELGKRDRVFSVKPFDPRTTQDYPDYLEFRDFITWTYSTRFEAKESSIENRLRVLAQAAVTNQALRPQTKKNEERVDPKFLLSIAIQNEFKTLKTVPDTEARLTESGKKLLSWLSAHSELVKDPRFSELFFLAVHQNLPRSALSPFDVLIVTDEVLKYATYCPDLVETIASLIQSNAVIEHIWAQDTFFKKSASSTLFQKIKSSFHRESYDSPDLRPNILDVEPLGIDDLPVATQALWKSFADASVEFATELIETYPDSALVFALRDAEPLGDVTRLILQNKPEQLKRVFLTTITGKFTDNSNGRLDQLKAYYHQEFNSLISDPNRPSVQFFDGSYNSGKTFNLLRELVPELNFNPIPMAIWNRDPNFPSSRTAMMAINKELKDPGQMLTVNSFVNTWEGFGGNVGVPHTSNKIGELIWSVQKQRWIPISSPATQEQLQTAIRWMKFLHYYVMKKETKTLIDERRAFWKSAYSILLQERPKDLLEWCMNYLELHPNSLVSESLILDVLNLASTRFKSTYSALSFIPTIWGDSPAERRAKLKAMLSKTVQSPEQLIASLKARVLKLIEAMNSEQDLREVQIELSKLSLTTLEPTYINQLFEAFNKKDAFLKGGNLVDPTKAVEQLRRGGFFSVLDQLYGYSPYRTVKMADAYVTSYKIGYYCDLSSIIRDQIPNFRLEALSKLRAQKVYLGWLEKIDFNEFYHQILGRNESLLQTFSPEAKSALANRYPHFIIHKNNSISLEVPPTKNTLPQCNSSLSPVH